jgi:hypothetical protein
MKKKNFIRKPQIEQDFINACEQDDIEKVKEILHGDYFKSFPNQQLFLNEGLCTAVRSGFEVMRYLLTSPDLPVRADINENADRPLRLAFYQKELKYVEYLCSSPELTKHAKYIKSGNEVPFLQACERGTVEMVQFLLTSPKLKKHVPLDITNNSNNTGLFEACRSGRLDIVKYLLTSPELPVKPQLNSFCVTWAVARGHVELVRYLCFSTELERVIDISSISDICLQAACEHDQYEMMKVLVEECKLTMTDKRDWSASAFEHAASRASNQLFNYILYEMNYEPTEKELNKVKNYWGPRKISVEDSLEKRELFRNLNKNLISNKEVKKKPKI